MIRQDLPGAYGFRFLGLGTAPGLLFPAPSSWPVIDVAVHLRPPEAPRPAEITPDRASIALVGGGRLTVDRGGGSATFFVPEPLTEDDLVHPNLAPVAGLFANWLGRESFHAGGLVVGDGVWGVVGERRHGKSSLLAWLASRGWAVFSDDLLVVSDEVAFAGPRMIDLREPIPDEGGRGASMKPSRQGSRLRVSLPPVDPTSPVKGWLLLGWADEVALERVPPSERLGRLALSRGVGTVPDDAASYMSLASLPMFRLLRPKRWDSMPLIEEMLRDL